MDDNSKEQQGTFQAYMIKVLEVLNLAPANGANRWVVTCKRELLEDTELEFDLFMEDITTYMGDEAVGNAIGIKKGNKWELPTRELSRVKFQDSNINYLKKIGMYSDKVTEKSSYPMNNKRSKNTQFVYTPKTNNKAWSKHLFPETKTTPKKQPPQSTQLPSQTANMNPTLAPTYDDTSSLTQPSAWASEFENYKQMMERDKEVTKNDISSIKTMQNTFMKDVAEFRKERQEERKERQEDHKTLQDLLTDFKNDRLALKQEHSKFAKDLQESNLQFKKDMTQQYMEQQQAFLNLQTEVQTITNFIKNGPTLQPHSPVTAINTTHQQPTTHQVTPTTHQITQPLMDTSTQQPRMDTSPQQPRMDTSTQKPNMATSTQQQLRDNSTQQQQQQATPSQTTTTTNQTTTMASNIQDSNTNVLEAFQDPAIFVDIEAEGTDHPDDTQADDLEQDKPSDTSTIQTGTTASNTTTPSSLQTRAQAQAQLKRKVASDQMDISDGQRSIEKSRAPQGSSPNEGRQF